MGSTAREVDVNYAYTIHAVRDGDAVRLPCATAWVALERCRLFAALGWSVVVFDLEGIVVPSIRMEASAQAEVDAALKRVRELTDRPGSPLIQS